MCGWRSSLGRWVVCQAGASTGKLAAMAKSRVANPFEDTTRMSPAPGPQAGGGQRRLPGRARGLERRRDVQGREGAHRHGARRATSTSASSTRASRASTRRSCRSKDGAPGTQNILEDMGSTNGTFCNGTRVQRQVLADGDKILLGSTTILKFSYQDKLDEMFQRQMSESALRDGLTKAFNKRYFTRAARERVPLRRPARRAPVAAVPRHRPLQAHQRRPRPPRGRPRARRARQARARRAAQRGHLLRATAARSSP